MCAMSKQYLSRDQVRAFDKYAIEQIGIPAAVLMENAGRGAAQVLQSIGINGQVVIACGALALHERYRRGGAPAP